MAQDCAPNSSLALNGCNYIDFNVGIPLHQRRIWPKCLENKEDDNLKGKGATLVYKELSEWVAVH